MDFKEDGSAANCLENLGTTDPNGQGGRELFIVEECGAVATEVLGRSAIYEPDGRVVNSGLKSGSKDFWRVECFRLRVKFSHVSLVSRIFVIVRTTAETAVLIISAAVRRASEVVWPRLGLLVLRRIRLTGVTALIAGLIALRGSVLRSGAIVRDLGLIIAVGVRAKLVASGAIETWTELSPSRLLRIIFETILTKWGF